MIRTNIRVGSIDKINKSEVLMLYGKALHDLEIKYEEKGLSPEIRENIRKSKICIIDDKIEDLKSMLEGLKSEGFTNIVEHNKSPSINSILRERFDLIILDLEGVAKDISEGDGISVLKHIKTDDPSQPIIIVSGSTFPPDVYETLNKADLVRTKPVKSADLAYDVEKVLRIRKDRYWASIEIVKELNRIQNMIDNEINFITRFFLRRNRKKLEKALVNEKLNKTET
jgi:DNA-binding response OmpR family regulator